MPRNRRLPAAVIGVLITVSAGSGALAQKSGGILRVYSADSPPGLNIYEQATPWGQGPLMSVYGWVFHEAENASGFAKGFGAIKFDLSRRHSSLAHIAWNQNGLVYSYDEYKRKFGRP